MLDVYADFAENFMAVPVLRGIKTENERFAGAEETYCIEGLMQDGKALQCGTSHDLSQGFAKAFNISFLGKDEKKHIPYQNSWGFSQNSVKRCQRPAISTAFQAMMAVGMP